MTQKSTAIFVINDFSGGQNSANPADSLELNEGTSVQNLVILPRGRGIRTVNGDSLFNSSAMNSGANVQGLLYYQQASGSDFLMAVAGDKIFKSDSLDGTMDDITGSVVVTAGQNNTFTPFVAENEAIFVGGAPDAPFKWTGSGNAALLGGSPPSGNFGFYHNNRAFIGNTTANPSRIQWSVLDDIEDWSGTGSGSADIQTSDGDQLVGNAILSEDRVLLFKQNSIFVLVGRTAPFPVIRFKQGIGAVNKHAIVHGPDGLIYFMTPMARMSITDGFNILGSAEFPRLHYIDDVFDGFNSARLNQIRGIAYTGKDFRWIIWVAPNGSATTNDLGIYWDIDNRCWGTLPDGFAVNVLATTQAGALYGGNFAGQIHLKDDSSVTTYASNGSATIVGLWRTGWNHYGSIQRTKYLDEYRIGVKTEDSGKLNVRTGIDHSPDIVNNQVVLESSGGKWDQGLWDVMNWGGKSDFISPLIIADVRGRVIQTTFDNKKGSAPSWQLNEYSLIGKVAD